MTHAAAALPPPPAAPQHKRGFCLGFTTDFGKAQLQKFGHQRTIIMDATFGTNKYKYHLTTLMVIGEHGSGVPVAWIIHKYEDAFVLTPALDALADMMGGVLNFCPKYFLIDASAKETRAIKDSKWGKGVRAPAKDGKPAFWRVVGAVIMYCIWHVKRAWKKALKKGVTCPTHRAAIWAELTSLLAVKARFARQGLRHPLAACTYGTHCARRTQASALAPRCGPPSMHSRRVGWVATPTS